MTTKMTDQAKILSVLRRAQKPLDYLEVQERCLYRWPACHFEMAHKRLPELVTAGKVRVLGKRDKLSTYVLVRNGA